MAQGQKRQRYSGVFADTRLNDYRQRVKKIEPNAVEHTADGKIQSMQRDNIYHRRAHRHYNTPDAINHISKFQISDYSIDGIKKALGFFAISLLADEVGKRSEM